jgi:hypothetical protein
LTEVADVFHLPFFKLLIYCYFVRLYAFGTYLAIKLSGSWQYPKAPLPFLPGEEAPNRRH